jgi:hypothetical protein
VQLVLHCRWCFVTGVYFSAAPAARAVKKVPRKFVFVITATVVVVSGFALAHEIRERMRPAPVLWAWERAEDLRFLKADQAGVAYLAQTITAGGSALEVYRRRQPLLINPETKLIAVTRVEAPRSVSLDLTGKVADEIARTGSLSGVSEIQVDFDAGVSQREFYAAMLRELRSKTTKRLSITALASWCMGDPWIRELPIDEAVPMVFQMGPDDRGIRRRLSEGDDWGVEACRNSYGVATFEKPPQLRGGRALYWFSDKRWTEQRFLAAKESR